MIFSCEYVTCCVCAGIHGDQRPVVATVCECVCVCMSSLHTVWAKLTIAFLPGDWEHPVTPPHPASPHRLTDGFFLFSIQPGGTLPGDGKNLSKVDMMLPKFAEVCYGGCR